MEGTKFQPLFAWRTNPARIGLDFFATSAFHLSLVKLIMCLVIMRWDRMSETVMMPMFQIKTRKLAQNGFCFLPEIEELLLVAS